MNRIVVNENVYRQLHRQIIHDISTHSDVPPSLNRDIISYLWRVNFGLFPQILLTLPKYMAWLV